MAWTYGGTRIFVTESAEDSEQIIARLQPLAGDTVLQVFGYTTPISKLGCYIVGDTDKNHIESLVASGVSFELVNYDGVVGDFYLKNVSIKQIYSICQSLRTDLPETANVYIADLELYKDE